MVKEIYKSKLSLILDLCAYNDEERLLIEHLRFVVEKFKKSFEDLDFKNLKRFDLI